MQNTHHRNACPCAACKRRGRLSPEIVSQATPGRTEEACATYSPDHLTFCSCACLSKSQYETSFWRSRTYKGPRRERDAGGCSDLIVAQMGDGMPTFEEVYLSDAYLLLACKICLPSYTHSYIHTDLYTHAHTFNACTHAVSSYILTNI
jgi:hypothetical protein